MMLRMRTALAGLLLLPMLLAGGCSSYRATGAGREPLERSARETIERFRAADPTLERFGRSAHAYAVFPSVVKGAVGVGGARGRGVVFERDVAVGEATLTQGTIGFQLGGQDYSQVIFFQDQFSFDRFRQGNMELAATASAVAAAHGAAAAADWEDGVAVFVLPRTGLMFEAAVGGQKFSYLPW